MRTRNVVASRKRRKKVLARAKGFWGSRSKHIRRAKEFSRRALAYAYRDRRAKKREFRSLWIVRINAAARARGISYKELIAGLKRKNILLSRDILAQLASEEPVAFDALVEIAKN